MNEAPIQAEPVDDGVCAAIHEALAATVMMLAMLAETQAAILDTIEGIQRQLAALTPQPAEADAEA